MQKFKIATLLSPIAYIVQKKLDQRSMFREALVANSLLGVCRSCQHSETFSLETVLILRTQSNIEAHTQASLLGHTLSTSASPHTY